ncbi:hypothetical protein P775_20135 [Puniceibacterium antarcticum]|uniref:Lipoprotein n=1 Tax=Puniceibacterium antarcticum TaxID=1206336 RepID=A0A2G8RB45_9RHOB|nr:hypothetical protein [Puniceibacterium antarcticum]PIL18358.1 hypothetical protein P775_20135 [Puniceibacterium antarcticum]
MKILAPLLLLAASACATTTPLPDVKGSVVRPLNPTKWDYQAAVLDKQKEIGVTPRIEDAREGGER